MESTFHYHPLWRGGTCISVSIQVHLYPQLKGKFAFFERVPVSQPEFEPGTFGTEVERLSHYSIEEVMMGDV